ncbi:fatty acyl-CoA reductase 1-like [Lingula anatina]|uniref:Fatty acyl-CoA reductase n=1 Tax=Lingula anatina TaxID=7574 RepID=A0A1S3IUE2_LINAN|nr:fatty acyl-CoA reductase 1-like [Lingula anatina]|eukprot:XP_013401149.1 fatty acyl-CoA reductase 1-like [Lingula anatina]
MVVVKSSARSQTYRKKHGTSIHLQVALEMNTIAIKKMITLCRKIKNLDVFLHVSTAYANCDRHFIEEVVYPPPCDPNKLIEAAEWMTDEMLNKITPQLIGDKPNTYTYTKQLAEHILVTEAKDLPLAIVRPSIVGAAWREPVSGWIDNLNGPGGLYVAAGKGLLKISKGDPNAVADIIPVDLCVNMIIAAAWHTVVHKPKEVLIYHTTIGNENPVTWGEMEPLVMKYWKSYPLDNCFRRPKTVLMTKDGWLHNYWVVVSHLIPAYLTDLGLRCIGQKPRMVRIFEKVHKIMGTLEYFTHRQWEWTHHNRDVLLSKLSAEDKKTFYLDPRPLHWPSYIEGYCLGAKMYTLQEDLSGLPAARAHIRKLRNIRYTFNTIVVVILWRLLVARSQIARNLWFFIMGLVFKFVQNFHITSTIQR